MFGVFGNFRLLCVFCPSLYNDCSKLMNYLLEFDDVIDIGHVQPLEIQNDVLDESGFLIAFGCKGEFRCLDDFFRNGNVDYEGSVIRG